MKIIQFCMISTCAVILLGCLPEKEKALVKPAEVIKAIPLPEIPSFKK